MKSAMTDEFKKSGVGPPAKAKSILQRVKRVRALWIRGDGLGYSVPSDVEGRSRGRHPTQGIWTRSVSRPPNVVHRFNPRCHPPQW